jgi:hypothetical protein
VTFLADIQRKQREQRALRQRIEQELAEREIDSDTVTVLVPRALAERLRRFAAAAAPRGGGGGNPGGARAAAEALLAIALEQAEPLFAPGPPPAPKYPTRSNGARQ